MGKWIGVDALKTRLMQSVIKSKSGVTTDEVLAARHNLQSSPEHAPLDMSVAGKIPQGERDNAHLFTYGDHPRSAVEIRRTFNDILKSFKT